MTPRAPESTQEAIREGQLLPEGAYGKGGPKVPKRSPGGAQEVPRTTKERPRAPKNEFERRAWKYRGTLSKTLSENESFQRVKTFKSVKQSSISAFRASAENAPHSERFLGCLEVPIGSVELF